MTEAQQIRGQSQACQARVPRAQESEVLILSPRLMVAREPAVLEGERRARGAWPAADRLADRLASGDGDVVAVAARWRWRTFGKL